jgi:hypothetical protein
MQNLQAVDEQKKIIFILPQIQKKIPLFQKLIFEREEIKT